MSTYEYTDAEGDLLGITPCNAGEYVVVTAIGPGRRAGAFIRNTDAPTVAAELLKAAGHNELAEHIEEFQRETEAATKFQERRTAVVAALLPEAAAANNLPQPHELSTLDDRAIDRIIELEDKLEAQK